MSDSKIESRNRSVRKVAASAAYGLFTGTLAGLVGLGGAELQMPFILYFLRAPLQDMITANIIISLANSALNFALRARLGLLTFDSLLVAAAMVVGSVPGAYAGASLGRRVSQRKLKAFIAFILALVLFRLAVDVFYPANGQALVGGQIELLTSAVFGFVIGMVAGSVGVAGGEYRIPVFTYLFGMQIKVAGTASQLVSIPTLIAAVTKHAKQRAISRNSLKIALMLGAPSIVGVVLSNFIILLASNVLVKLLFGSIIAYTIARLTIELVKKNQE